MNKTAPAAVLLSLCLIMGCGEQAVEVQEEIARPVKIITFGGTGDVTMLEYAGTVAAAQRSEMGFEVPGRINEFLVVAGEAVQEGQVRRDHISVPTVAPCQSQMQPAVTITQGHGHSVHLMGAYPAGTVSRSR